ncbi:uncharacterized protein SOCG_03739 [Schizosaccharomyces octosporus yFS286]|uniref:Uncharacterized protein n=1 Tax=Schizosaccharomyces octosporus (strain yFS286) TaxID=483514 RepID=S9PWE4_SCHOY|nr:uncharacterized protein SOCG_03739 [Schizosaccharomyces octosporus yFS286]EPX71803.1 hypothetical protein SOCG_03739 [Schizosaccharomyces octosporus yFS286]
MSTTPFSLLGNNKTNKQPSSSQLVNLNSKTPVKIHWKTPKQTIAGQSFCQHQPTKTISISFEDPLFQFTKKNSVTTDSKSRKLDP